MSKLCINCQNPLKDDAKFCPKCGTPVKEEQKNNIQDSLSETSSVSNNNTVKTPNMSDNNIDKVQTDSKNNVQYVYVNKKSSSNLVKIVAGVAVAAVLVVGGLSLMGKNDAKEIKTGTTATGVTQQQTKSVKTAEDSLANFGIKGKVINSTFGSNPNGFLANVDNRIYLVDTKNNQAASIENYSYVVNDLRNQQNGASSAGRIIPQFLILNDKHGKDDDKGEWRNSNHFLPVFVRIKVDGAGNLKSEGKMSSGKGAAPSHYQGDLEEQKNIDLANLFLKELVPFTSATLPAAPVATKPAETTAANRPIKIMKASATSFLKEPNQTYPASQAVDGDTKTCWAEGVPGYGHNEGIDIVFDDVYDIKGFNIWTGYQKSEDLFYKNTRPVGFMVRSSDGYSYYHEVKDIMGMQRVEFKKPVKARSIMITLMEFRPGSKFEDTCISEISFY